MGYIPDKGLEDSKTTVYMYSSMRTVALRCAGANFLPHAQTAHMTHRRAPWGAHHVPACVRPSICAALPMWPIGRSTVHPRAVGVDLSGHGPCDPSRPGGRRSAVGGRRSAVGGRRSAVGGRRSAVGGRRSAVGGRLAARGPPARADAATGQNRRGHKHFFYLFFAKPATI